MVERVIYVGLDVHKDDVVVAWRKEVCGAMYGIMAGSRTRRRRWPSWLASLAATE